MPPIFDPVQLHDWLSSLGPWAASVFLVLQALQVVFFWFPGEVVQIAGGLAFGVWQGTLLSTIGLTLGNLAAFFLARLLGKRWVERWLSNHNSPNLEALVHHPRLDLILAGIFFLPFLPKDIFCYLAGLSDVKPLRFVAVTTVARVPSLLLSSWVGALAAQGLGSLFVGVLAFTTVLGAALFLYRKSLLAFLVR